jgi:hypothetical protein
MADFDGAVSGVRARTAGRRPRSWRPAPRPVRVVRRGVIAPSPGLAAALTPTSARPHFGLSPVGRSGLSAPLSQQLWLAPLERPSLAAVARHPPESPSAAIYLPWVPKRFKLPPESGP